MIKLTNNGNMVISNTSIEEKQHALLSCMILVLQILHLLSNFNYLHNNHKPNSDSGSDLFQFVGSNQGSVDLKSRQLQVNEALELLVVAVDGKVTSTSDIKNHLHVIRCTNQIIGMIKLICEMIFNTDNSLKEHVDKVYGILRACKIFILEANKDDVSTINSSTVDNVTKSFGIGGNQVDVTMSMSGESTYNLPLTIDNTENKTHTLKSFFTAFFIHKISFSIHAFVNALQNGIIIIEKAIGIILKYL